MEGNVFAVYDPGYNFDDVNNKQHILEEDLLRIEETNNCDGHARIQDLRTPTMNLYNNIWCLVKFTGMDF